MADNLEETEVLVAGREPEPESEVDDNLPVTQGTDPTRKPPTMVVIKEGSYDVAV